MTKPNIISRHFPSAMSQMPDPIPEKKLTIIIKLRRVAARSPQLFDKKLFIEPKTLKLKHQKHFTYFLIAKIDIAFVPSHNQPFSTS